ncbi:hypothetical protein M0R89_02010 [Halorussus limi]|uniref:Uncharacterized protein n=1 Tax=Halorussus limi TaxID=2938695 RepID=A0A8U0HVY5_9EURY|nr:hypothetical protein [Halorussus limi]UPV74856.1 hypothetical protein M0R89_02010 [Halorussus limi]
MSSSVRKDELAVSLLASVFVGFAVVLAARRLSYRNCPVAVPADAYGVVELGVWTVHLDWAGCRVIAPLGPAYLGGLFLLGLAAWTCR